MGSGYTFLVTSDPLSRFRSERKGRVGLRSGASAGAASELVDTALRIYQRQGLRFLRLTALPSLFCMAALIFVMDYIWPSFASTRDSSNLGVQALEVVVTVLIGVFVCGPLLLTGLTYGSSIVVWLTSAELNNKAPNEMEAQRFARAALPKLFVQNLRELLLSTSGVLVAVAVMLLGSALTALTPADSPVAGLVALIGVLGLIFGGLIFLFIVSLDALVVPTTVLEGLTGKAASKRSRSLLAIPRHRNLSGPSIPSGYGPIWNIYLASLFVFFGAFYTLTIVLKMLSVEGRVGVWLGNSFLKTIVSLAVQMIPLYTAVWLVIPIWATAITVIYYDRRVRLEGYDIFALNEAISEDRESRFSI